MSDDTDIQHDDVDEALEQEARDLGWVPEDEFRGPKERWVDAKTFVEKGRHILPIMKERMAKLQQDLLTRDSQIDTLRKTVESSNKAIEALEKHFSESTKRQVEKAKKDLIEQIKKAREDGDVDAEFALTEQLDSVKKEASAIEADNKKDTQSKKDQSQDDNMTPDVRAWLAENSWYSKDEEMTIAMDRVCHDLRRRGESSVGKEFLDKAYKLMQKRIKYIKHFDENADYDDEGTNVPQKRTTSKVEGSGKPSSSSGGGGKNSFASLPADAKKACHEDKDILVGTNKRYKTLKEWEDAYAKMYYGYEE
jgi:hypothetical protein